MFSNKNKIVYYENTEGSIEGIVNEQIIIGDLTDTVKVRDFTPNEAIFNAVKKENNDLIYYELNPL